MVMESLDLEPAALATGSNAPVMSVGELSQALKRMIEQSFSYVRVRGEICGCKRHGSGHVYLGLKDTEAVMDAVIWRGTATRLDLRPDDGLEVICTGRLTTFPGRSKYQLVIERMELAGEGAILKMLEERKRKLAAEGLFAAERKRKLPYLPAVIGVVTSPTGAVIRDILHRLGERFPRQVLVWPVAVQGPGAAEQIAAAIRGFGALSADGAVPRPDLIIVARGGGSLEDLMAFNEEVVVRAAAASPIPLVSAVGHETDTTLIDFASDLRAPTPTAAAELAVPVRLELLARVTGCGQRLDSVVTRTLDERRRWVEGVARGLPDAASLLDGLVQRLDDRAERLDLAWARLPARAAGSRARGGRAAQAPARSIGRARAASGAPRRAAGAGGRPAARDDKRASGAAGTGVDRPLALSCAGAWLCRGRAQQWAPGRGGRDHGRDAAQAALLRCGRPGTGNRHRPAHRRGRGAGTAAKAVEGNGAAAAALGGGPEFCSRPSRGPTGEANRQASD